MSYNLSPNIRNTRTGCGALNPTPREVARKACPTFTSAEFSFFYDIYALAYENGAAKEDALGGVANDCAGNPVYDADSDCRDCSRAMIEAVW